MIKSKNSGKWTKEETTRLLKALENNSRWDVISEIVGTRTSDQCRSHNQKLMLQYKKQGVSYFNKLKCLKVDKATQYETEEFPLSNKKSINQFNDYNQHLRRLTLLDTKKDTFNAKYYSEDFTIGINESAEFYTC